MMSSHRQPGTAVHGKPVATRWGSATGQVDEFCGCLGFEADLDEGGGCWCGHPESDHDPQDGACNVVGPDPGYDPKRTERALRIAREWFGADAVDDDSPAGPDQA